MSIIRLIRVAAAATALSVVAFQPFHIAQSQSPQIQLAVDTAITDQDGLLTLYGSAHMGGEIGLPVAAGDLNGDGRGDVVFCEMYASADPRQNNGQVNVYLSDGRDTGIVDASQSPASISTVIGQRSGDLLGASVAVGDVNGDGFADLVVSATGNSGPGGSRPGAGAVYVVPGSKTFSLNFDLGASDKLPAGLIAIYGPDPNGRFGMWVDTGDVDGDGIADLVIGMDQMNSGSAQHTGGAYIIFGSPNLPGLIDLASPPPGVRITRILGANQQDHWGAALHVGDMNNDGIGDVVISAALDRDNASYVSPADQTGGEGYRGASDGGLRPYCGEVYILYGSKNWPALIDLRSPPANATHIIGAHDNDMLGSQIFSADLNGDGKRDLVLGALVALAPDGKGRPGGVFIVYGSDNLAGATIDMLAPDSSGQRISIIYGEESLDCAGDSVRAYDINGDGRAELFIASPNHGFSVGDQLRANAGDTKIIFGQSDFLPPVIKLYDPPAGMTIYRLAGAAGDDQSIFGGFTFSYRITGADVDGDGYVDYVANAMHGDGATGGIDHAGNVYVFSGRKLSARLGLLQSGPPVLTSATLSANGVVVTQAPAGQSRLTISVNGSGFRTDTRFIINGSQVTYQAAAGQQAMIALDDNTAVRNAAGPLVLQAQNTSPLSALSNTITAGTLTGPQIASTAVKRKPSGAILLKIFGQGFESGDSIAVADSQGGAVPVKSVAFIDPQTLTAKITAQVFGSGSVLTVRVMTGAGVSSNQGSATVP
jgi:hypothetical protein